jgi:hypothetical protein
VLISDNGGRVAYYNTTASTWRYVGTDVVVYTPPPGGTPPVSGYVQWYTTATFAGTVWNNAGSSSTFGTVTGTPTVQFVTTSSSTATGIWVVAGTTGTVVNFGVMPTTYSLFFIARKPNAANAGWLMSSNGTNTWLSGFFGTSVGVAYHEGWVGSTPPITGYGSGWLISADLNSFYRPNGNTALQGTGGTGTRPTTTWGINARAANAVDVWQVAEIIVYDTTLTAGQISSTEAYLASKYQITLGI